MKTTLKNTRHLLDVIPVTDEKIERTEGGPSKEDVRDFRKYVKQYKELHQESLRYAKELEEDEDDRLTGSIEAYSVLNGFVHDSRALAKKIQEIRQRNKQHLTKEMLYGYSGLCDFEVGHSCCRLQVGPDELTYVHNVRHSFPRASLPDLRRLCDSHAMMILPVQYASDSVWSNYVHDSKSAEYKHEEKMLDAARVFNTRMADAGYDVYLLTPIQNYSIEAHVANPGLPYYAGQRHITVFDTLDIIIPMLSKQNIRIEQASARLNDISVELKEHRTETARMFEQIEAKLVRIQERIDAQQREVQRQAAEARKREDAKEAALAAFRLRMRMLDPIIIAVERGTDVELTEARAIVGPGWGPDFSEEISVLLDDIVVQGQRDRLTELFLSQAN